MDQPQEQKPIKPIEEAVIETNSNEPSMGQKTSNALNNAGSAVAETTSGWYDSIKKAFGMGSTVGGRRKKKRTKRAKKSAKKTKRSKK